MHPILDQLELHTANHPGKLATADQSLALDYQSFRAVACGLSAQIAAATDRPRVGILAPTSVACAAAVFGCWYAGRTPVPLNFMLAPEELGRILRDAGLDLLITIEHFAAAARATGLKTLLLNNQSLVPGRCAVPDVQADDIAAVIYTSGTAAEAKGVCLTYDNIARNAAACVEGVRISPDQVFLGLLPQFHAFGFTTTTVVPLAMGATVHFLPRFSPITVSNLIAEKGVSVFITIASMFGALSAMKNAPRDQYATLTHAVSGGEPLPLSVARIFEERFGVRICEGYGMTEASPVVSVNAPHVYKAGTVGPPLPGITVIAADEHGREVPHGTDGQLLVRGHCVMKGYLNKPAETAAVLRDGWLWTGDIGRVDESGHISITGRAKEMMIVGGENVFPFEIESVLVDHPSVGEAAVIGVRDDIRGELPVAFVIPREGAGTPNEVELRQFCRERLAAYKVPRQIYVCRELPRGSTGKILKRALKPPTV